MFPYKSMLIVAFALLMDLGTARGQDPERDTKAATVVKPEAIETVRIDDDTTSSSEHIEIFVCGYKVDGACVDNTNQSALRSTPHTTITLSARHHRGRFLYLDAFRSSITQLRDSSGANLLAGRLGCRSMEKPRIQSWSTGYSSTGYGQHMKITVDASVTPTAKAHEVILSGTLVFQEATDLETFAFDAFAFEEGRELQVADCKIRVTKSRDAPVVAHRKAIYAGVKGVGYELLVENQSPMRIESVRLATANGIIQVENVGHSISRANDSLSGKLSVLVPPEAGTGKLEVAYWTKTRKVEVPFTVTVTAGL